MGGRQYSLDIFMDQTDRYDYLIQHCSYNNKYNFIDKNRWVNVLSRNNTLNYEPCFITEVGVQS